MSLNRENQKEEPKTPKISFLSPKTPKITVPDVSWDDLRTQATLYASPRAQTGSTKPTSARCLCSPTTHVGSFRCRHHRTLGMSRGGSVGSNLSLLGSKSSNNLRESKLGTCGSGSFDVNFAME